MVNRMIVVDRRASPKEGPNGTLQKVKREGGERKERLKFGRHTFWGTRLFCIRKPIKFRNLLQYRHVPIHAAPKGSQSIMGPRR